jgi:hypothetical protein
MPRYNAKRKPVDDVSDPEDLKTAAVRFNEIFKLAPPPPPGPVLLPSPVVLDSSVPRCQFCKRPIAEFAYAKETPKNKGLCKQLDCRKHRQGIKRANPDIDVPEEGDDDVLEEGDAVDAFKNLGKPEIEVEVKSVDADASKRAKGTALKAPDELEKVEEEAPVTSLPSADQDLLRRLLAKPWLTEKIESPPKPLKALRIASTLVTPLTPKNEDEIAAIQLEAKRIEEERLAKEERRRIKKNAEKKEKKISKRVLDGLVEGETNLRIANNLTKRELAKALADPRFSAPFQVKDESVLLDATTSWGKRYKHLKQIADEQDIPIEWAQFRVDLRTAEDKKKVAPNIKVVEVTLPDGTETTHPAEVFDMPRWMKEHYEGQERTTKSYWLTYEMLMESLPNREETMLTSAEMEFYVAYASGNLKKPELELKYGEFTDYDVLLLENRIVRHARKLNLIRLNLRAQMKTDDEVVLEWDKEVAQIGRSGGALIGGRVHGSRMDRYGRFDELETFRTNPKLRESRASEGVRDSGAPDRDDFGDESGA